MAMKLFLSLVLFGFCQFAFGEVLFQHIVGDTSGQCFIHDAKIEKVASTSSTVTYKFTHFIESGATLAFSKKIIPQCFVQFSKNTKTTNIAGGWKFQAANLDDIKFSLNNVGCGTASVNSPAPDLSNGSVGSRNSALFNSDTDTSNATCQFSYSITLTADPNSSQGVNALNPLINVGFQNGNANSFIFSKSSLDNSLGSVTPDPSPQSTCSLTVPSNLSLGNAKSSALTGVNARSNSKDFSIAVNCSKPLGISFKPNVQMTFGSALGTSCFALNTTTDGTIAASGVVVEITRKDNNATVCPTTATVPTTLVFKENTTPTVSYSDSLILRAAFVNSDSKGIAPKPGVYTTTATFTITSF